jgi:hypothetical protein
MFKQIVALLGGYWEAESLTFTSVLTLHLLCIPSQRPWTIISIVDFCGTRPRTFLVKLKDVLRKVSESVDILSAGLGIMPTLDSAQTYHNT